MGGVTLPVSDSREIHEARHAADGDDIDKTQPTPSRRDIGGARQRRATEMSAESG